MNASVVALALTLFAAGPADSERFVLAIGTEGMPVDPKHGDLYGKDSLAVRRALVGGERLYRGTRSRVIAGSAATRSAVLAGLDWLVASVGTDDLAIIQLSTHGSETDGRFSIQTFGHWNAVGESVRGADRDHSVFEEEFASRIERIRGTVLVWADTCNAGGLLPKESCGNPRRAWLLACRANEDSSGQDDAPAAPHGYFVIALCEALAGRADLDRNGVVTLGEVHAWLPRRAKAFRRGQNAVERLPPQLASLALAEVDPAHPPVTLYDRPRPKGANPFGEADVPDPLGADVLSFAAKVKALGEVNDENAPAWGSAVTSGGKLDGSWSGRWRGGTSAVWVNGDAELRVRGNRVHILFAEDYLIEAERSPTDPNLLRGRYRCLTDDDSSPWVGRIVSWNRIDGYWSEGRFDFRRRERPDNDPAPPALKPATSPSKKTASKTPR
jgi:hypothetical protein